MSSSVSTGNLERLIESGLELLAARKAPAEALRQAADALQAERTATMRKYIDLNRTGELAQESHWVIGEALTSSMQLIGRLRAATWG